MPVLGNRRPFEESGGPGIRWAEKRRGTAAPPSFLSESALSESAG
ncbi:hypothetical protein [Azospirillum argentinense]